MLRLFHDRPDGTRRQILVAESLAEMVVRILARIDYGFGYFTERLDK